MITTRGFTLAGGMSKFGYMHRHGFTMIEDNDAPYRFVWLNRESLTTITYCEGDLITEECESADELALHLDKLRDFYGTLEL